MVIGGLVETGRRERGIMVDESKKRREWVREMENVKETEGRHVSRQGSRGRERRRRELRGKVEGKGTSLRWCGRLWVWEGERKQRMSERKERVDILGQLS